MDCQPRFAHARLPRTERSHRSNRKAYPMKLSVLVSACAAASFLLNAGCEQSSSEPAESAAADRG